jgi:RNA polymerase sigma-70 factor, ECF subfamily
LKNVSSEFKRNISPQRLLILAKQGDNQAFEDLYNIYFAPIFRYVYYRLDDKSLAEDLVQEVFLKVYKSLDRIKVLEKPPLAYFFTVARNLIIDSKRKKIAKNQGNYNEAFQDLLESRESIDAQVADHIDFKRIRQMLSILSGEQREAIILKFISELSYREIAIQMEKNEESIRQIICRGLRKIRESFRYS